jgi:formylglycine-generating enzyme required for sulfatase activity
MLIPALLGGVWSCGSRTGLGSLDVVVGDGGEQDATTLDAPADAPEVADVVSSSDSAAETTAPSCAPGGAGLTNCGPGGSGVESCCTSLEVSGGTFYRSYDDVTYRNNGYPATVSTFRLDKYEVTVGRFRQFVTALAGGWLPAAGSGKHPYLNGGKGLENSASPGTYETGWVASDDGNIAPTTGNLACGAGPVTDDPTWTPAVGNNESKPMNCVDWYMAYAFCIWDRGFLPSEAEWNYAGAGGGGTGGQRAYPWSNPSTSTTSDCSYANFDLRPQCVASGANNVGSESPSGDGRWGQADLAGNVTEWNLDSWGPYINPCTDCANLTVGPDPVIRGGDYMSHMSYLLVSYRSTNASPLATVPWIGVRCARTP